MITVCAILITVMFETQSLTGLQGKGYPDMATRQLVATLAKNLPPRLEIRIRVYPSGALLIVTSIPMLAVVDADPYGIDILSVYIYGSSMMAHEEQLVSRRVRWVGVMISELSRCVDDVCNVVACISHIPRLCIHKDELLKITKHDERKVLHQSLHFRASHACGVDLIDLCRLSRCSGEQRYRGRGGARQFYRVLHTNHPCQQEAATADAVYQMQGRNRNTVQKLLQH